METDHFEWDDEKAADVLRRQGVSFSNASRVFDDGAAFTSQIETGRRNARSPSAASMADY
jgi:uncharacterized DUF497 family protein